MKKVLALLMAASMTIGMLSGCGTSEPEPAAPVEEEEPKELSEEDLSDVIMNLGDKYVVEGSEADHFFNIIYDPSVITSFKAEGDIATDKIGTYLVQYTLTVDEEALKEAPTFEDADLDTWVEARDDQEEKTDVKGTELKVTNTITVVSSEDGQTFAEDGKIVYIANDEIMIVITEDEPEEETEKEDETSDDSSSSDDNKTSTSDNSNNGGTKPSGGSTSGSTTTKPDTPKPSGGSTSGGSTQTPSAPAECSHNWVQQYKTVHHDAKTHTEQVQVGSNPIYQSQSYTVCKGCGARNPNSDHGYQHAINGENAGTYTAWEDVIVGYDPVYENRTVVDQAAYDEQVPNGYKCSKCGKTK